MIVYGNHEVPDAAQMMCQLTDMLWMRARSEQEVEQTFRSLHDQIADLEARLAKSEANRREQGMTVMALEEEAERRVDELIEAQQDRDSWKEAYKALREQFEATVPTVEGGSPPDVGGAVRVPDGKRPVDPFGKDGINRTGPYTGLGGTMQMNSK